MTDIVERLRKRDEYDRIVVLDHLNRPWPYGLAKSLEHEAADEIERLRAERDRLAADLSKAQRGAALWIERAGLLQAERDRLRKALREIAADCEADYPPSHGAIRHAIRAALGETEHD